MTIFNEPIMITVPNQSKRIRSETHENFTYSFQMSPCYHVCEAIYRR